MNLFENVPLPRFKIVDTRFSKSTFPGNPINYQIVQFRNNPDTRSRTRAGEGRVEEGELRQTLVARSNENLKFRTTGRGRRKIYRPASLLFFHLSIEGGGRFRKTPPRRRTIKISPPCRGWPSSWTFEEYFLFARYTKETCDWQL